MKVQHAITCSDYPAPLFYLFIYRISTQVREEPGTVPVAHAYSSRAVSGYLADYPVRSQDCLAPGSATVAPQNDNLCPPILFAGSCVRVEPVQEPISISALTLYLIIVVSAFPNRISLLHQVLAMTAKSLSLLVQRGTSARQGGAYHTIIKASCFIYFRTQT